MQLTGCFVAIVTPFKSGTVDSQALAAHAEWMVDQGVSGIVVCGTTGETATMVNDEKIVAMNVVYEAVHGRAVVVGGAGNNSTAESVEFVHMVNEKTRVDAIMSVVPYYVKPDQAGISAHFKAICDVAKAPVILYNVPGRTVVAMSVDTMVSCAEHPAVVGIKEASGDLHQAAMLLPRLRAGVSLMSGDDATAMPFIALGGSGLISVAGNVAPKLMSSMCAAARAGENAKARSLNFRVAHVHNLMFKHPSPIPAKIITESFGFGTSEVRLPLVQVDATAKAAVLARAAELEITRT